MRNLMKLFLTFAKIGLFTFGGGYAMLALLQEEIVNRQKWATDEELLDYYAIGQCTPGIIAVNTATFIGYKFKKVPGAIFATAGMVFPSLVIIMLIAGFLQNFLEYEIVGHIFGGIRVVVAVLIFNAVFNMAKKAVVDKICLIIAAISTILAFFISPIWIVIAAAVLGLFIKKGGAVKK